MIQHVATDAPSLVLTEQPIEQASVVPLELVEQPMASTKHPAESDMQAGADDPESETPSLDSNTSVIDSQEANLSMGDSEIENQQAIAAVSKLKMMETNTVSTSGICMDEFDESITLLDS